MERKVERVPFVKPILKQATRVAAYARVSSGKDAMLQSLSAQVSFYSNLIQNHIGWQYVGVYADEAKTGTKEEREHFQRMLEDCRTGKIDLIITKSVSRFARNTVTLLNTVRELKDLGIDVFFEEQNLHTISAEGELMLTLLASYAQEESRSASENQKWRVKKNFQEGLPWNQRLYGYRFEGDHFEIIPEEAALIRRICDYYLSGMGFLAIAKKLRSDGVKTRDGTNWTEQSIRAMLTNYNYTGNLLLQKTFCKDHIKKQRLPNNGEYPKYLVEQSHEAIIPIELFNEIQAVRISRAPIVKKKTQAVHMPFAGKVYCGLCGKTYKRRNTTNGHSWICRTQNSYGKKECPSQNIPEAILLNLISEVTNDCDDLDRIDILPENMVRFTFKGGATAERHWQGLSRSGIWTPEMREAARQRALKRREKQCREK